MTSQLFSILILVTSLSSAGQSLLKKPNQCVNGRKEGEWSEFNICDTIDFNGQYHPHWYQAHGNIKYVIAEGTYKNGLRQGFWKSYWIANYLQPNQTIGTIKSIVEYKDDVPCNLVIEYYETGKVKAIGHYETFPINRFDTTQVVDWCKDKNGSVLKDTLIHITISAKPKGQWHYFKENGEAIRQ